MTTRLFHSHSRITWAAMLLMLLIGPAMAAPGAHGPNGEHLDGPAQAGGANAAPRLEAKSELFELVATLGGGELSILIDRFETNEPVLGGQVEVATGSLKAMARFHADHGDYAVDDPKLLEALARPGEHALVFTVTAGVQSDLLDGTLRAGPQATKDAHDHSDGFSWRKAAIGVGILAMLLTAATLLSRPRARKE